MYLSCRAWKKPNRYGTAMHLDGRRLALGLPAVIGTLIVIAAVAASRAGADASPHANTQAPAVTKTVLVVGDSVAKLFSDDFVEAAGKHGYAVVTAAHPGCPAIGFGKVYSTGVKFKRNTCSEVVRTQDAMVEKYRPALVIWWSRYEVAPRLGPDGKVLPLGSSAYWRTEQASLEQRARALTARGARLVTIQIEPPGPALAVRNPSEKHFLVGQTLLHRWGVVKAWDAFLASHRGPTVFSISVDSLICHDAKNPCNDSLPNGETARPDGIHYSDTAQRLLAPPIFDAVWRIARLEPATSP